MENLLNGPSKSRRSFASFMAEIPLIFNNRSCHGFLPLTPVCARFVQPAYVIIINVHIMNQCDCYLHFSPAPCEKASACRFIATALWADVKEKQKAIGGLLGAMSDTF